MKKISLIILFILAHLIGVSQNLNDSLPKQNFGTSRTWKGVKVTNKQFRDSLNKMYLIFCDSLNKRKPIKDGKNKETIFQDLVFSKMIEELKLNLLDYNIVNISEIVRFRDSLIIKKISYDIYNVDITYKTLDNLNINQYRSEVKYNSTKSKKTKLLMCFRTLIPDNKNNYKINFFILEGY